MNDKKNLVIALPVIALAVLAYVIWADTDSNQQTSTNTEQNQNNNNITEPPPPPPVPQPMPTPSAQGPDDIAQPASEKFADNNWLLTGFVVDGKAVDMNVNVPQALTLNFDKVKNTYNGFGGCNSFSGTYTFSAADKFDFGAIGATKKGCVESGQLESKLFQAMDKVDRFMITAEGNLVLKDGNGQLKIEYKKAI